MKILRLASGLRLACAECGDPQGDVVFFCHGWPGSRNQASRLDGAAKEFGFRMIAFDRPGVSQSDRQPGRTLGDWPSLLEEVAVRFEVERFRMIGVSGGGPYALLAAHAFPERVLAVSIVCGAPPIAEMRDRSLLMPPYRLLLALYDRRPSAVLALFRVVRPFTRIPIIRPLQPMVGKLVGKSDGEALRDPAIFDACFDAFREAWEGSAVGVFEDAQVYARPWGFAPEEIRVPVHMWHGRDDRNFRWPLAEQLAARIPNARLTIVENEGHYSLPFRQGRAILEALRAA